MELPLLLSLGALVSESLSTRRDSVLAPDRLWVDEREREREELEREREDDRLFDFFEEPPPERLLLLDRDFCWGIPPCLLLKLGEPVFELYPNPAVQTLTHAAVQIRCSAGKSRWTAGAKGAAGTEAKRGDNHGPDNAILEQPVNPQPLGFESIQEQKQLLACDESREWLFALVRRLQVTDDFEVQHAEKPAGRRTEYFFVLAVPAELILERLTG